MKIGMVSRFCESCQRDVKDFTTMTREEVLVYLLTNRDKKVCGRIRQSQLDYHHQDLVVTIEAYLEKNKNSNLAFYALTIGSLLLASCETNTNHDVKIDSLALAKNTHEMDLEPQEILLPPPPEELTLEDSTSSTLLEYVHFGWSREIFVDRFLLGFITTPNFDYQRWEFPPALMIGAIAEVMPEFPGGFDHLSRYLKRNVRYPAWERKNKIEGTVYVTFEINASGEIGTPKILKSVEGARNFDREVKRVVQHMPNWKPALEQGVPVSIQYSLPIKFAL